MHLLKVWRFNKISGIKMINIPKFKNMQDPSLWCLDVPLLYSLTIIAEAYFPLHHYRETHRSSTFGGCLTLHISSSSLHPLNQRKRLIFGGRESLLLSQEHRGMFWKIRLAIFCLPLAQRAALPELQPIIPPSKVQQMVTRFSAGKQQRSSQRLYKEGCAVDVFLSWVQNTEVIVGLLLIVGTIWKTVLKCSLS